jgi:hypothetical protein
VDRDTHGRPEHDPYSDPVKGVDVRLEVSSLRSEWSRTIRSPIGRETLGSLGLKISNTGFAFLGTVLLARILTPTGYGI